MHVCFWKLQEQSLWAVSTLGVQAGADHTEPVDFRSCKVIRVPFLSPQGNGTPHQYSCLENPMDEGAW